MNQLGTKLKLYIDPSGVGGSSWSEFDDTEEDTLNQSRNVGEIRNRASDWVKVLTGKRDASVEVTATFKKNDPQYEAIRDAFNSGSDIGIAAFSGVITDAGEEGLQADCKVVQMNRLGPLEDAVKHSITFRPSAESLVEPSYAEITT